MCVCFLSTLWVARGAAPAVSVPASPGNFENTGPGVQFVEFLGRRAIDLSAGQINVKGAKFRDGNGGWAFQCELHSVAAKAARNGLQ